MTIDVEPLRTLDDFSACEHLQRRLLGEHAGAALLGVPALRAIAESGGLLLGVRQSGVGRELAGAVVDLSTTWEGFPAHFNYLIGVSAEARNGGIGLALRVAERQHALAAGVEVVRAWVDPLRSSESHIFLNRLGAIGTKYERSVFGELPDRVHRGLATDRICAQWWLRSPRTVALLDEGRAASHLRAGLHEMVVATRTTSGRSGQRTLVDVHADVDAANVLVEIPVDIELLRDEDPAEARRWRLGTREVFERLLVTGYLLVGLVHEGGRSFQLLEKADRSGALGRS
jgi:predicted GNAT superfamily acetyltransferase